MSWRKGVVVWFFFFPLKIYSYCIFLLKYELDQDKDFFSSQFVANQNACTLQVLLETAVTSSTTSRVEGSEMYLSGLSVPGLAIENWFFWQWGVLIRIILEPYIRWKLDGPEEFQTSEIQQNGTFNENFLNVCSCDYSPFLNGQVNNLITALCHAHVCQYGMNKPP